MKPFKFTYEKEIVMYAYFKKLDYFSTECTYAPFAARGIAREFVKDLELARPSAIVDLIKSAEELRFCGAPGLLLLSHSLGHPLSHTCSTLGAPGAPSTRGRACVLQHRRGSCTSTRKGRCAEGTTTAQQPRTCERCGYISSQPVCKACLMLEGLNTGNTRLGILRARRTEAPDGHRAQSSPHTGATEASNGATTSKSDKCQVECGNGCG